MLSGGLTFQMGGEEAVSKQELDVDVLPCNKPSKMIKINSSGYKIIRS